MSFPNRTPVLGLNFGSEASQNWNWSQIDQTLANAFLPGSILQLPGGPYLPAAGGTLTGPLILAADPIVALGAATKQYVDNKPAPPVYSPILQALNNQESFPAATGTTPVFCTDPFSGALVVGQGYHLVVSGYAPRTVSSTVFFSVTVGGAVYISTPSVPAAVGAVMFFFDIYLYVVDSSASILMNATARAEDSTPTLYTYVNRNPMAGVSLAAPGIRLSVTYSVGNASHIAVRDRAVVYAA